MKPAETLVLSPAAGAIALPLSTNRLMSTARKNSLTRMIEDSVTKVIELTTVPVQISAGDAISRWERYGVPASLGTAVGLFLLAANRRELQLAKGL